MSAPEFSQEQWEFLAALEALQAPTSIQVLGELVPVPPGPLFDLLNRAKPLGWITQQDDQHFCIGKDLSEAARRTLERINSTEHLATMVDKLQRLELPQPPCAPEQLARLLKLAGRPRAAGETYLDLGLKEWHQQQPHRAWEYTLQGANCLAQCLRTGLDKPLQSLYTTAVIRLSQLALILGQGATQLPKHLVRARRASEKLGDQRSCGLLQLHLGRLHYFSGRSEQAVRCLSAGLNAVENLGDQDILDQAAGFIGLLYFMQGRHRQAVEQLERAERCASGQQDFYDPYTPVFLGGSLIFAGDFHRAIGSIDCNWRSAKERGENALAATLEAELSMVLLLIQKPQEAQYHLNKATALAEETQSAIALRVCRGAQALHSLLQGDPDQAQDFLEKAFPTGEPSGFRFYSAPWILEMLFEFERAGHKPLRHINFTTEAEAVMAGHSVHLQGTVLRLQAQQILNKDPLSNRALPPLQQSLALLEQSGDPVQQSKTLAEMARLDLGSENREEAIRVAKQAWRILGGYADCFFPDDLRHLIDATQEAVQPASTTGHSLLAQTGEKGLQRFLEAMEALLQPLKHDDLYARLVLTSNRYFGAERGALFWFDDGLFTATPDLKAACNLTAAHTQSEGFKNSLALVLKTFQEQKPCIVRATDRGRPINTQATLCLPLAVKGKVSAVLYHDNSYLEDCFDFLDRPTLNTLARHFSGHLQRLRELDQLKARSDTLRHTAALAEQTAKEDDLVFQSPAMRDLMAKVDKIAGSLSTALLLGETGVGKELTARRLHANSPRHNKPFVVIDSTAIPEGLIESELFGHEKGAFTGADRQRKGRMELADQGTLFIDEVGELPLGVQAKLLRALQERSFQRVGGSSVIKSNFRLIAATNRDLAAEVKASNFREDLFYRLNVIPIAIPPLRERVEDIPLLAQHFLDRFSKRYQSHRLLLDKDSITRLKKYPWPGNIRELENTMERTALLSSGDTVELDLPTQHQPRNNNAFADSPTLEELQRRYIEYVLERTDGKISGPGGAAEWLGLNRSTLLGRMRKLGIKH